MTNPLLSIRGTIISGFVILVALVAVIRLWVLLS